MDVSVAVEVAVYAGVGVSVRVGDTGGVEGVRVDGVVTPLQETAKIAETIRTRRNSLPIEALL